MAGRRHSRFTPGSLVAWVAAIIFCVFALLFTVATGGQIFYVAYRLTANADSICQPTQQPTQPTTEGVPGGPVRPLDRSR